jgi:hypothetical protein
MDGPDEYTFEIDQRRSFLDGPDFDDNVGQEKADHEVAEEPEEDQAGVHLPTAHNLPPVPKYEPYKHPEPAHQRELLLPGEFNQQDSNGLRKAQTPLSYFKLFFTDAEFETIALNTNLYRAEKIKENPQWANGRGKLWRDVTPGDIKVFEGLLIYMGLYRLAAVKEYWDKSGKGPLHP